MKSEISQLRVMIVEDQDRVRQLMKDVLNGLNVLQVYEYKDAEKALRFLARSYDYVDIVLCDMVLEGSMNGLDLLERIRSCNIDVNFLMISGKADETAIKTAKKLGVNGYILKPFSAEQIEVKLRVLMSQVRAA